MNTSPASVTARARLLLVAAAVLAGALAAVVLGLSRWVTGTPSLTAAAVIVVAVVALGPVAALLPAARRTSGTILAATAWTAAVAALLGLASLLLALGRLPDHREQAIIAAAAAGLVIAATVAGPLPARAVAAARRLAGRSDRLPEDLLASFADRSAGGAPLADLLRELAETLRRAWRLSAVAVWTGGGDALALTTAVPAREVPVTSLDVDDLSRLRRVGVAGPGWLRTWIPALLPGRGGHEHGQLRLAPAIHGETVLALLVVERPEDADRFGEDNERALAEVAQRLAVVLRNRDLDAQLQDTLTDLRRTNAELRASRARLVAAADAERRRIERDLHDGAHGIYPSLLRDAGLKAALPAAARRSALPVTVTVTDLERYPPEVEAAIYFCCLEGLQNVAKHAKGATVRLRAWAGAGQVHLEITDDGPGFDPDRTPPGVGLQNMADRLGAVGGSVFCRSAPGEGTTVLTRVPIDPAA